MVEYYPESNEVRLDSGNRMAFENWIHLVCVDEAKAVVNESIDERSEIPTSSLLIEEHDPQDGSEAIGVSLMTTVDRHGEVTATPSVSYGRLKEITPSRVTVDLEFKENEYQCDLPVMVKRGVFRLI